MFHYLPRVGPKQLCATPQLISLAFTFIYLYSLFCHNYFQNENIDVYGDDVEVDYRGYEVTVENFVRLLTGRLPENTPKSKRLLTDAGSNILIYMTGNKYYLYYRVGVMPRMKSQKLLLKAHSNKFDVLIYLFISLFLLKMIHF